MSNLVAYTKIVLPKRRAEILSRQRLLDILYDLEDYKLTIVAAPAGYGKTSLLIDLAHQYELPFCWYSIDSLDQDPQRFITHFMASIAVQFPQFVQEVIPSYQNGLPKSYSFEHAATLAANRVYECIQEHFVIVLDNYHQVDEVQEINDFVNQFIQSVSENCHLVILSRSMLPLSDLPLLVARSEVGALDFQELSFTPDEVQAFMQLNYGTSISRSTAENLVRETEGWVTGLLLSAQTILPGITKKSSLSGVSGVNLYDYLAHQVLNQQTTTIRDALLHTSIFDEFDASLCEAVIGPAPEGETWQKIIDSIIHSNLFALSIGENGGWLRYHNLFQDFLRKQLAEEYPGEEIRLLQNLASAYVDRQKWEEAFAVYKQLGDTNGIADLLEQAGTSMIKFGRISTLAKWLDELPSHLLVSRPALLARRGLVTALQGDTRLGLSYLDQAESEYRKVSEPFKLAGALTWRAFVHYLRSEFDESLADANEVLTLTPEHSSLENYRAEAYRIRGLNLRLLGKLDEAIRNLDQSLEAYRAQDDQASVAKLSVDLGAAHADAGEYTRALSYYQPALDFYKDNNNVFSMPGVLNDIGVLHCMRGDYLQAYMIFEDALAKANQIGHVRIEALVLTSLGDLYKDLEAPQAAVEAYNRARDIVRHTNDNFLLLYLDLSEADLFCMNDNPTLARDLLISAEKIVKKSTSNYERGLYQIEAGRLALVEKNLVQAISILEHAIHTFQIGGQRSEEGRAHLLLAVAYYRNDDLQAAHKHLSEAFRILYPLENHHTLVIYAKWVHDLLIDSLESPQVSHQARYLLDLLEQHKKQIPTLRRMLRRRKPIITLAPPSLKIQALGRAHVMLDGKPISNMEWQSQTTRDLFFYILANPNGVSREVIGESLWPNSTASQLKVRFKNNIYRLRKALRQDVVVLEENYYVFNKTIDYDYDVEAFKEKIAQAQKTESIEEKIKLYQDARRLYRGDYLPEVGGTWVVTEREFLRQAYVDTSIRLAACYFEVGEYKKVIEESLHLLSNNPCEEEAHRLIMRAYAKLGNRAAVIHQYQRCQQALLKETGFLPSKQTDDLYQELTH